MSERHSSTRPSNDPQPVPGRGASGSLFREEVLVARRDNWLGQVHLSPSRMGWATVSLATAAVLAGILILALGRYTRTESVQGRLVPAQGLQTVVAPVSGTVVRRTATEGMAVTVGAPLLEISPDIQTPDGAVGEQVAAGLSRQRESLRQALIDLQESSQRQATALRERIVSLQQDVVAAAAELKARAAQTQNARQMLERIRPLQRDKIISAVQIQQYENQMLDAEAQRSLARRNQLQLERELADARRELADLPLAIEEQRRELQRELAELEQQAARNRAKRSVLVRAPGAGTVSGLATKAGQAVTAGERLLAIVPADDELHAELWVPSRAVGTLASGDRVRLRYDAFPYQKFGQQAGRIIAIARSTLLPEQVLTRTGFDPGEPVYRVVVAPRQQYVQGEDRRLALRAGMTLDAELLLERQRLYQLLLSPFEEDEGGAAETPP